MRDVLHAKTLMNQLVNFAAVWMPVHLLDVCNFYFNFLLPLSTQDWRCTAARANRHNPQNPQRSTTNMLPCLYTLHACIATRNFFTKYNDADSHFLFIAFQVGFWSCCTAADPCRIHLLRSVRDERPLKAVSSLQGYPILG